MQLKAPRHPLMLPGLASPLLALLLIAACATKGLPPDSPPSEDPGAGPASEETSVAPGINSRYTADNVDLDRWVSRFSGESREVYVARFEVVEALGLEPGDRIADVGAGTGLYTQLLANSVGPSGKVYAVDISQPFLDFIAENAAEDGYENVETILGEDHTSNLPDASVDVIFHCDTYHHFEYPKTMTADLARALAPGGEMFVIDFERIPGVTSSFLLGHVRADKETVTSEIEASGFELVEQIHLEGLSENYMLRFRKRESLERAASGS